mmetsp:Transcript_39027/g.67760  ORF Transcript_39027/g.67760 Transcript_39027/m.67760 type:complete len:231 (-) Transcript_39027:336-1028(-)
MLRGEAKLAILGPLPAQTSGKPFLKDSGLRNCSELCIRSWLSSTINCVHACLPDGRLRSSSSVALRVGVRSHTCQSTISDDLVFLPDLLALKMVLQDLPDASCIASLSGKAGSGNVRGHAMPRHSTPRMISWRWLREPNITCIPSQSSIFQSFHNDIPVTQLPTSSVHHEAALLEEFDGLCVDHVLRFRMQWAIQSDNVHLLDHFLPIRMVMQVVLLLHLLRQTVSVRIV